MGWYVHIHVAFPCDDNGPLAEVAKRHIGKAGDCREAEWFLKDLSERTGHNPGPKGGLCLWGMVGNYTQPDEFCEVLRPFWLDIYKAGIPCDFERIIVFSEQEQSEQAIAHEISYDEETDKLSIKRHDKLPFFWNQF